MVNVVCHLLCYIRDYRLRIQVSVGGRVVNVVCSAGAGAGLPGGLYHPSVLSRPAARTHTHTQAQMA